ncbi:hypothetical protein JS565_17710 [Salmonella enterica subsp. enterica serovar Senftenberg]|nr:hypothetical protein [Salmonella enterica subsp. enterica serovar Senftenberg]
MHRKTEINTKKEVKIAEMLSKTESTGINPPVFSGIIFAISASADVFENPHLCLFRVVENINENKNRTDTTRIIYAIRLALRARNVATLGSDSIFLNAIFIGLRT